MDNILQCEITLVAPPRGIAFGLQKGRAEIVGYTESDGDDFPLAFTVRVKESRDGRPDFAGPFVQGRPGARFVYVAIGQRAGQENAFANGRAKIHLSGIDWAMIDALHQTDGGTLTARYAAAGPHGAPTTASVPLLDPGWAPR